MFFLAVELLEPCRNGMLHFSVVEGQRDASCASVLASLTTNELSCFFFERRGLPPSSPLSFPRCHARTESRFVGTVEVAATDFIVSGRQGGALTPCGGVLEQGQPIPWAGNRRGAEEKVSVGLRDRRMTVGC